MLTEERIERYARHILLREVGGVGQSRLLVGEVRLHGLGGVGEWAAAYLALAGVGRLELVERDTRDHELPGPIVGTAWGERAKALVEALPAFNPDPEVRLVSDGEGAGPGPHVGTVGRSGGSDTLCLEARLENGQRLEVRLAGDRFTLRWDRGEEGTPSCERCVATWFAEAEGADHPALAALAGSLAAGEILCRTLGIGTVPDGIRWFVGGLPVPAPLCDHS